MNGMLQTLANQRIKVAILFLFWMGLAGCAQVQLPRLDPLGRSIFLPRGNGTPIVSPFDNSITGQGFGLGQPILVPGNAIATAPTIAVPNLSRGFNSGPAFTQPPSVPSCANGQCGANLGRPHIQPSGALVSHRGPIANTLNRHRRGSLITTPHRIVAPVGSEIVVLAGICGGDGYFVTNQPLEWMLSQDSAGQIVEVGGLEHSTFNNLISPTAKKFTGDYAWGRTGLKEKLLTRGTDTLVDDIRVLKGQSYITMTSGSQGTSYLTTVAPKTDAWPERKRITRIHWVDGVWSIPAPSSATAGTVHNLNTQVVRSSDGSGVQDWEVRYQVVGGVPAEFGPDGTQSTQVTTNARGQAPVQIRQPAGQAVAGQSQVRVEIVRPGFRNERELVLESGITTVNWSSPALTIRAIGPRTAGINQPFNYRVEVTNPGDQVARNVVVSTEDIVDSVAYISSTPKPKEFGNRFEWEIGDVAPGAQPKVIEIQMRSNERGVKQLCFEVASQTDDIRTDACAETEVTVPCLGLNIDGPTSANVGDQATFNFDLTNECERTLENITIRIQYDPALNADGVPNPAELQPIARLLPGETVNLPSLTFLARQAGTPCFLVEVSSDSNDRTRFTRCIEVSNVNQPQVQIDMEGQGVGRVGDLVRVNMRVINVGNVPLDEVVLVNEFSRSLEPVNSSLENTWSGDDLLFRLGRLEPRQEVTLQVEYRALNADGEAFSRAAVTNSLGVSDQTGVPIRIEPAGAGGAGGIGGGATGAAGAGGQPSGEPGVGVPGDAATGGGLQVSVTALDVSGVAVGNNATFQVNVFNNRGIEDQNIVIRMLIPPGSSLQVPDPSQTGLNIASRSADGTVVTFEPRREMRAQGNLTFPISLRALTPGQITFAVQATSARNQNPVEARDTVTVLP